MMNFGDEYSRRNQGAPKMTGFFRKRETVPLSVEAVNRLIDNIVEQMCNEDMLTKAQFISVLKHRLGLE